MITHAFSEEESYFENSPLNLDFLTKNEYLIDACYQKNTPNIFLVTNKNNLSYLKFN